MTAPTIPIPTTAAELASMANDDTRLHAVLADPAARQEFFNNYAAAHQKKDPGVTAEIREEIQRGFAELLKANGMDGGGKPPVPLNAHPLDRPLNRAERRANGIYNKKAVAARLDGKFENPADFLQSVWHLADRLPKSADMAAKGAAAREIMNSFGTTIPADGGFLVPEEFRATLLQLSLENSVVRPLATVIPMSSQKLLMPMVDSTTNATSVFGGLIFYWAEEGSTLTESQSTFGVIGLEANKLTGFAGVPNELVADAPAFNGYIDQQFPKGLAFYEDKAFFNGTGVGEPRGFITNSSTVSVAAEAGQATKTVLWENIVNMYSRMLPSSLPNALWIIAPNVLPQLFTMALSVGTGGAPIFVTNGAAGAPMTLLGIPIRISEKASTVGTTGDISLVDLSYYLIGDRQIMTADSSTHYLFGNDKTAFRIIQRLDGRPWLQSAITPANGATETLSPFVQLATR